MDPINLENLVTVLSQLPPKSLGEFAAKLMNAFPPSEEAWNAFYDSLSEAVRDDLEELFEYEGE